jgi:nucleoside-diphosphate-sugar epimerase
VRVIDDLSTGHTENLQEIGGEIDFVRASLNDTDALARVLEDVELVFHEAAIPSVPRSVEDPRTTHDACAEATFSLLVAARERKVRRLVYAASSSAYGDQPTLPKTETMRPEPLSPYAAAKLVGEYYCQVWARSYNFETVCLRYFNIFGPRQDPSSQYSGVISRFIAALSGAERPVIYGDGEQSRDFTFVGDVVAANLLASEAPEEAWGRVFNVAYDHQYSVNQLLAAIQRLVPGEHPPPEHREPRPGDIRDSRADITEAKRVLGYEPKWTFADGLRQTVDWFASRQP